MFGGCGLSIASLPGGQAENLVCPKGIGRVGQRKPRFLEQSQLEALEQTPPIMSYLVLTLVGR